MPSKPSPAYSVQRSFVDFDELAAEARQWDLDLCQLDRGPFRGELLQFGVGGVHITEACFGRTLRQKGSPPAGLRTIGVPARPDVQFSWRGKQINGRQLLIFPQGAELSSVSKPGFHVYTCSFPEDLLATVCETLRLDDLADIPGDSGVVHCTLSTLAAVRRHLSDLCEAARSELSALANEGFVDSATRDLPGRLLGAIATSRGSRASSTSRKRDIALNRAEAFIERHACEDIRIRDICSAAQVSQRTLEYAFIERFGVTPKAFLTAYRLNAVRRQLRSADPANERIADIANRTGFWHMGQFAADYEKQFGELPSQTLRRVNGN